MKNVLSCLMRQPAVALLLVLLVAGCTYPRMKTFDPVTAKARFGEPILLIPPLNPNANMVNPMKYLGRAYVNSINNRVNGQVTYAGNIESLEKAVMSENLITNGIVNAKEVSTIARTIGCNSAITVRVLEFKQYPPFRMVIEVQWIDSQTSNIISRLYQIVDMTDSETDYRFSNYSGDGPARTAYEQFAYYKAISQTAALKPTDFMEFVAFYSTKILFDQVEESTFSWRFWYIL